MEGRDITLDVLAQTGRELAASASALQSVVEYITVTPEAHSKISAALANVRSAQSRLARRSGPFTTLPFDVLAEIFNIWAASYVTPAPSEDDQEPPDFGDRVLPPAFTAAAVCRHWRAAALSCAQLWTRITLNMRRCATDLVRYLDLMLPRARTCTLDVTLDYAMHWTTVADGRKCDLLARLLARCRTLRVHWRMNSAVSGPTADLRFADSVLPLLMAPLLQLEEVVFEGITDRITDGACILTLCPQLRKLDLGSIPFDLIDTAALSNVESFSTHLTLSGLDLRDIATAWPVLHTLAVQRVVNPLHLRFQQLRRLRNLDCTVFNCFRSSDDLPLLQTLEVGNSASAHKIFEAFIKNSPTWRSLHTVALVAADWSSPLTIALPRYLAMLDSFPNVHTLRLEGFTAPSMLEFYHDWATLPGVLGGVETLQHVQCVFCIAATTSLVSFLRDRNQCTKAEVATCARIQELSVLQEGEMELDRSVFPSWMKARLEQLVDRVFIDTTLVRRPRGCVRDYPLYPPTFF